ncbi:hypothetical protein EYF80_034894 [Liparis tanakae]|uniref:Uncharacterized protein n=1 Tax=Liparis tanakae TaxID=230148 RepID=A0A4Z2GPZ6_9TELE|nr:hypothetical protein EYF80_034894 [Liparis tanakae]
MSVLLRCGDGESGESKARLGGGGPRFSALPVLEVEVQVKVEVEVQVKVEVEATAGEAEAEEEQLRPSPSRSRPLTFERLDDLELVGEVGPPRGPQVEVPEGHDALRGARGALLERGVVRTPVSAPPAPLSVLLEEAPLAQVVLSAQRQAAQGEPQVLHAARLLLAALRAAAEETGTKI